MTRRIAITGASGLIGRALTSSLESQGHQVVRMVRDRAKTTATAVFWSVRDGVVDTAGLEGVDAVVHLAGAPIGSRRWNTAVKERIRNSRTQGTRVLAEGLASMADKPAVLVSGSAIGVYGSRGDEVLTEESPPGSGFLADVVRDWEAAADAARAAGIRVVHPRTGIVLTAAGGALQKMLLPFKAGVGGRIGSGSQWMSWVSLLDEVRAIEHLIDSELAGPVNITAPNPVDNATLTSTLGEILHRPTVMAVPAFAIRAALGEMGEALLLDSQRVVPTRLLEDGFSFHHPNLASGLAWAVEQ